MTSVNTKQSVLYVVVCAAPPAQHIQDFIVQAKDRAWDTCVIVTPQARGFVDIPTLITLTGHMVRSDYKQPDAPDALPKADAIVVAPATFNTMNKLATGIADTLAASILCEGLGRGIPLIVAPCLKQDLANHPAFPRNLVFLQHCGVHILHDPKRYPVPNIVPWEMILDKLGEVTRT